MSNQAKKSKMNPSRKKPLPALIAALMRSGSYDHPVKKCELIETHASWVILTGAFAYKIKKPVDLGFLDFSTLEKRRFCCEEELRLNRRFAPEIYLGLAPVFGTAEQPKWIGSGKAIEYAVKMIQFPQESQLDRALAGGNLRPGHMDAFARLIACVHQRIAVAGADCNFGNPDHIRKPVLDNFFQIRRHIPEGKLLEPLAELEDWTQAGLNALEPVFVQRKSDGFIRECHGDLHLRNLAWINDAPVVFDCIEFNPDLRWIDIISDAAFLVMDLQDRHQPRLAHRFLNLYLENTGDYPGLRVLQFYLTYRALVRAKVNAIRALQPGSNGQQAEAERDFFDYLQLAMRYAGPGRPLLIITHGMSASGKSTLTQPILEHLEAIRIRSDVERKRLFGMEPDTDGNAVIGEGIYTDEATERTYARLAELAGRIMDAGYPVMVDAAFLNSDQRQRFQRLAAAKQVPYIVLKFTASPETLRHRIVERQKNISDADPAVLEHQLRNHQPLSASEILYTLEIDTESPIDAKNLSEKIRCVRQDQG
jgi:aminoglycoside phosphotransferase family enzyme/predicted kinase